MADNHEENLDTVLKQLGSPGRYHLISYFFLICCNAFLCFHHVVISVTVGVTPKHRCAKSFEYHSSLGIANNTSFDELKFSNCYVSIETNISSSKVKCNAWAYEFGEEGLYKTIVTEWNLVCDRRFYVQLSNSLYFVGILVGCLTLSRLSDRYGRKFMLLLFVFISTVVSTATISTTNLFLYVVLRAVLGICISVVHTTTNVLMSEISRKKYNTFLGILMISVNQISIAFGGVISWLLKDWRLIQIAVSTPILIPLLISVFLVPESYRWLIVHGRFDRLEKYILHAARVNRVTLKHFNTPMLTEEISLEGLSAHENCKNQDQKKHIQSLPQILKLKEMRKRLLTASVLWTILVMSYLTSAMNIKNLSENPYKAFIYTSAVDCIPILFTIPLLIRLGKRRILYSYSFIAGVLCVVFKFYNHSAIMLSGKMFIGVTSSLILFYAVDIFPTVVRNTCIGACVTASRIGSFLAPQLVLIGSYTSPDVPVLVIGILLLASAILIYNLPEMKDCALPDTIEEVENYASNKNQQHAVGEIEETTF